MSNQIRILCPGQGAQSVGMGRALYEASPVAKTIYDQANQVLGYDLAKVCFEGPDEQLTRTDVSQPAIFVTSVASYASAVAGGVIDEVGDLTFAGLSLGEYTALHLGGVFSFEDCLQLVAARGRFMQEAATATPSGMVAIVGADEAVVTELCNSASEGETLVPANYNAPGQIVVSGTLPACQRFNEQATARGFKAVPLKVAGAFHSPIMQPAADRLRAKLDQTKIDENAISKRTIFSNVTGEPHQDAGRIKHLLVEQLIKPVKWSQTMQTLIAEGGDDAKFIELAPGRTLAGLAKRINRRLPVNSLDGG